jgi:hypothetical protein
MNSGFRFAKLVVPFPIMLACMQSTATFHESPNNSLQLNYTSYKSDDPTNTVIRNSVVKLVCNRNEKGNLEFEGEHPKGTYTLKLTSKCCCPNECINKRKPPTSSGGLSIGSILLIVYKMTISYAFL